MRTFIYITRDGDFKLVDAPDARKAENAFRKHGFTGARHHNVTDITDALFEHIGRIEWKPIESELIGKMQDRMRQSAEARGITLVDGPVIARPIRGHVADNEATRRARIDNLRAQMADAGLVMPQTPPEHPNCRSTAPSGPGWTPEGRARLVADFNAAQTRKKWRKRLPYIAAAVGIALIVAGFVWMRGL